MKICRPKGVRCTWETEEETTLFEIKDYLYDLYHYMEQERYDIINCEDLDSNYQVTHSQLKETLEVLELLTDMRTLE